MTKMINQYKGIDIDRLEMMYLVYLEYKKKGIDLSEITDAFIDGVKYQYEQQQKAFERMVKNITEKPTQ